MKIRNWLMICSGMLIGWAVLSPVFADLGYNPGSVATIFDYVCFATKHCSAHVLINSAGSEIGTSGAPVRTDPTGTTPQPVSVASGAAVLGSLVDINNGTNTPWPGTGTTSLLGGVFGVYNQLAALNATAALPAPCKAAATWNASTGLTGTQPTACDGSAAPWIDLGAVGGLAFALGQQVAAASLPVVLPSAQITTLTPLTSQPIGTAAFASTQVSVAATATSILAARTGAPGTGRVSATITNTTTTPIYLGGSGVTTSTGTLLPGIVGASVTINTTAQIFGIVTTSTATVTALESF